MINVYYTRVIILARHSILIFAIIIELHVVDIRKSISLAIRDYVVFAIAYPSVINDYDRSMLEIDFYDMSISVILELTFNKIFPRTPNRSRYLHIPCPYGLRDISALSRFDSTAISDSIGAGTEILAVFF